MSRAVHALALVLVGVLAVGSSPTEGPTGGADASFPDPPDTTMPVDLRLVSQVDDGDTVGWSLLTYDDVADPAVGLCVVLIDTDGKGGPDRSVSTGWDSKAGRLTASVEDAGGRVLAAAAVSRPSVREIRITVRRRDLGDTTALDYFVACSSDVDGNGDISKEEVDDAPNGDGRFRLDLRPSRPSRPGRPVHRVAADDRIATAVTVSRADFSNGAAGAVVIARSDTFPDALSGTALAAAVDGPVLLTPPGALDPRTAAELVRVVRPGATAYLLGGDAALAPSVAAAIAGLGVRPVRIAGADRYATSVAVATDGLRAQGSILLATGTDIADALAAGPAAARLHGAVLLTDGDHLPPAVAAYLSAHPVPRYAVGGAAAAADPGAERIVGRDRYDTARLLAARFFPAPATVGIVSGVDFPDAFIGGAAVARQAAPLLLTTPSGLPPAVRDQLGEWSATLTSATVYGGSASVDDVTLHAVEDAVSAGR